MIQLSEPSKIASFDVDCQKTFTPLCPSELPVPDGCDIVDALNAQARLARYRIASKEGHSPHAIWIANVSHPQYSPIAGTNVDVHWVPHAIPGTLGFELLDGLPSVTDYDYVIWKGVELDLHPYGSCYHDLQDKLSTGVIEFLQIKQVTTVLIGGLATDYCVKNTALQLRRADFQVILNLSATRGLAKDTTRAAIEEMKAQGVIVVETL